MKVSGFSFLKNAVRFDYPVVEAITSVLPICDEFVIAIGKCDDGTHELIRDMNEPKIKIVETEWDQNLREGGRVLAEETNKAFRHIAHDSDWAFYVQADEVIHEKYLDGIYAAMLKYKDDGRIDGLLFHYLHFYGSFDYVGISSNWYSHEIRMIKNNPAIYSYKDAQGFRKNNNEKLNVKSIEACVYHYGWVRQPETMQQKQTNFGSLYRGNDASQKQETITSGFNYEKHVGNVAPFTGLHPKVMLPRIDQQNWTFDYDISMSRKRWKDRFKSFLKNNIGVDTYYRNYKVVKDR